MKITLDTVLSRASRTGNIYSAPGKEGSLERRLEQGEHFYAKPRRGGRWAKVSTLTGKTIGYTKSKRLSTEEGVVLADHWGYVDPKRNRPYGQSRRQRDTQPVVVTPTGELLDGQHRVEAAKEVQVVHALERLTDVVKQAEAAPLPDPARGRFAFFDRFCTMRERRSPQSTGNDVQIAQARYKFATSLIRTAAVAATLAYAAHVALPLIG